MTAPASGPLQGSRGRTSRLVPGVQAPTRHPRRGGLGTVRVGERLTVRFSGVDPDGSASVRLGPVHLSVPFGVPGEEAVVQVTKGGRRAEARLVALLRKSADVTAPRCRHFGRCGGCQWQHLLPELQRHLKTRLVKDYLKDHADLRIELIADTVGGEPWGYRNALRVFFAERGGAPVLGYHALGSGRVLDVSECPVQHPTNEGLLRAAREAVRGLGLPIYDRATGKGLVRGAAGLVSFATGEALLTLSSRAPLPDPTALVHALLDSVPGLVGILNTVQPKSSPELFGPRIRLLWGRDHIEEDIAGLRVRLRPATELPANPRGMALFLDAIVRAADLRARETALDLDAQTPLATLALARTGEAATGVAPNPQSAADAREAAAWNGVTNATFSARDPLAILAALARRRRPDVVLVAPHGPGLAPATIAAVVAAGVRRVVYVARSLPVAAADLVTWRRAGYAAALVQPVDLLPQTSRVHLIATLRRAR